jgi:hypothetical protein
MPTRLPAFVTFTAAILLLLGASAALAQPAESPAELAARIEKLIEQLDDDKFSVREKAEAELTAIGEPALEKLQAAAKSTAAERRQRADKILAGIKRVGVGLRHVSTLTNPGLLGAVTVAISPDGQFVYVPGFQTSAVNVFRRDAATGALEHRQTIADPAQIGGIVTVRLSGDGKFAVAACFGSKSVALFARDATSGELKLPRPASTKKAGSCNSTGRSTPAFPRTASSPTRSMIAPQGSWRLKSKAARS